MPPVTTTLLSVVASICATAILVYFVAMRLKNSADPGAIVVKWIITVAAFCFWFYLGLKTKQSDPITTFFYVCVAAGTAIFVGTMWAPTIGEWIASPFTKWYDGGDIEPEKRALYSIAIGHRKRGSYDKAIAEIGRQLAMFPDDFQGWMMLADIHFKDRKDLPKALETIEQVLTLPELPPKSAAFALSSVSDWHMELGDRDAARASLERIIELFPDSDESHIAAQRIAHLASAEYMADQASPRVLVVPHSEERIGLRTEPMAAPVEEDAGTTAARYLDHLREYPLDNEVREKLALVYANSFKRLDLAASELEQLIATPNQSPKNIGHWLNILADLQIRLANDVEGARRALQRIIDLFPKSAAANTATVRLSQLKLELNQNSSQRTLKLGSYEQNIGLKRTTTSEGTNENSA
jgi:tetratricopeptide (TPR) repeat protein